MRILLILSDEETGYPLNLDIQYLYDNLPGWTPFKNGMTFTQHRTASCACSPSRASLYSGRYPRQTWDTSHPFENKDCHNVSWVNGLASHTFPALQGNQMGRIFTDLGYSCHYVGKWHLSPDPTPDILNEYGWKSWIGPEPHGIDTELSGLSMDEQYVEQALHIWDTCKDENLLLAVNLVNPHDINLYLQLIYEGKFPDFSEDNQDPDVEQVLSLDCTSSKDLQPVFFELQEEWIRYTEEKIYCSNKIYHRLVDWPLFRRFYYYCLLKVDRLCRRLIDHVSKDKPLIIRTSDHGTTLGIRGHYIGKWFNGWEETLRVPLGMIFPDGRQLVYAGLSSSVDILPTMLGYLGLSINTPGVNLLKAERNMFYFITYDNPTRGEQQHRIVERTQGKIVEYQAIDFQKYEVYIRKVAGRYQKLHILTTSKGVQTMITSLDDQIWTKSKL